MIGRYHQGIYKLPRGTEHKYIGNKDNICWRSSWEKKCFDWLSHSPNIVRWSSEEVTVKYFYNVDRKVHTYFVDLYFEVKQPDGTIKKYLAEIKPYYQTVPPKETKNQRRYLNESITYQRNIDKWKYCRAFCRDKGMNFVILTERNTNGAFL